MFTFFRFGLPAKKIDAPVFYQGEQVSVHVAQVGDLFAVFPEIKKNVLHNVFGIFLRKQICLGKTYQFREVYGIYFREIFPGGVK